MTLARDASEATASGNLGPRADDPQVAAALQEYLAELEAGGRPDREALVARFPEAAELLAGCIDALEAIHSFAPQVGPVCRTGPGAGPAPRQVSNFADEERLSRGDSPQSEIHNLKSEIQSLGDFRIIRELGRGGMGIVYEAEELRLGRRVVLPFAAMLDTRQLRRFKNEARAAAMLKHPHIVSVYSVGVERGVHYYAMELVEGQCLAEVIGPLRQNVAEAASFQAKGDREQGTAQSEIRNPTSEIDTAPIAALSTEYSHHPKRYYRRVADLGIQAAEALHYAHQEGVIHRDIKPSNLLLDRDGKLHITDFGLVRIGTDASVTVTGDLVGTLRYMSPEQASGTGVVDHRSDIYSLGVTLYELATLRPAFASPDRGQLLRDIAEHDPAPPRKVRPSVPRDLETIILKSIDREPACRYATATELADELKRFIDDQPIHARRSSVPDRVFRWTRRHKTVALFLLVVLLMGVASLSLALYQQTTAHHQSLRLTRELTQRLYASEIALAQEAIQHHRIGEALEHLNACPVQFRGWEWRYLFSQADRSLRANPIMSTVARNGGSPEFSPDGTLLAIGRGARLAVYDATTMDMKWSWSWDEQATNWIQCAAFSPDSHRVVVGMGKGHAVMLDGQSGHEFFRIAVNPSSFSIYGIEFTSDGSRFATCDQAGQLAMCTAEGGNLVWHIATASRPAVLISLEVCGDRLATVDVSNDLVKIFDTQSGALVRELVDPSLVASYGHVAHADNPTCAVFSSDGSRICTTGDDGMIKLWNAQTGELLASHKGHEDYARRAAFSPDGQWIATAGRDSTIRIWHADDLELYAILDGHRDYTSAVAWSPDGRTIASSSDDNTLRIWDALTGPNPRTFSGHLSWFRRSPREDATASLAFTSQGSLLVSRHLDWKTGSLLTVWCPETGQELANLCGTCGRLFDLNDLATTQGRGVIVGAGADARIYIWELSDETVRAFADFDTSLAGTQALLQSADHLSPRVLPNPSGYPVLAVDITANGDELAWADSRGDVVVLDLARGVARSVIRSAHRGAVQDIAFSPDSLRLTTAGDDRLIRVWNPQTGEKVHELFGHDGAVHAVAFSPDGTLLASAGADRAVLLWNAENGELLSRHLSHANVVRTVAFHPSEPRFISASADGTVKLWSFDVDQPLLTLRPPLNAKLTGREVYAAKFSPDGDSLLAGIEDGTIRVWETQSTSRQRRAQQSVDLARRLVDSLAQEHELYARVMDLIASDRLNLQPKRRALALEIVRARLEHDKWAPRVRIERFDNMFEMSILFPGAAAADLEQTLAHLRHADELQPEEPQLLWWIGAALYRLSRYQEALDVLNQEESRNRLCLGTPSLRTAACKAMVLHELGHIDEARAEFALALNLLNEPRWSEYKHIAYFRALLREAEILITGESDLPDLRTKDIYVPSPVPSEIRQPN